MENITTPRKADEPRHEAWGGDDNYSVLFELAVISQHVVPIEGAPTSDRLPRRHAPARPQRGRTGPSLGRSSQSYRGGRFFLPCSSLIAASGRRTRRRGSQRGKSLHVSPGPEAFPAGTLEIALVRTGRKETNATALPCGDFASGGRGRFPSHHTRPAAWSRGECRRAGAAKRAGTTS